MRKILTIAIFLLFVLTVAACKKDAAITTLDLLTESQNEGSQKFQIDVSSAKLIYDIDEAFDSSDVAVYDVINNGERVTITSEKFITDSSLFNNTVVGKYEISVLYANYEAQTYYVWVVDTWTMITNSTELQSMTADGTYKLANDIDCSGVSEWDDPVIIFTGLFNGDEYKISGINMSANTSKVGTLFAEISNGMVCNVRFDNCNVSGSSETLGLITGLCNGGVFRSIEVTACQVINQGNYVGILAGRNYNTVSNFTFDSITVKNSTSVGAAMYGGVLIGDTIAGSNIICKNIDISITSSIPGGEQSVVAGRDRGGIITVENAIFRNVTMSGANKIGLVTSGGSYSNVSIKNALVYKLDIAANEACDIFNGKDVLTKKYIENGYYFAEDVNINNGSAVVEITTGEAITGELPVDFFTVDTTFDFNKWEEDDGDIKILNTTLNKPSPGATLVELKLFTSKAKTRYYTGDEYSFDGVDVVAKYSDGVEIPFESDDYTIDSSTYITNTAGIYTIIVTGNSTSVTETYDVTVVEPTEFSIHEEFATKIYIADALTIFDEESIVITALMSDGVEELLASSEYSVDASEFIAETPGVYTINVSYGSFADETVDVTVIANNALTTSGTSIPTIQIDDDYIGVAGDVVGGRNSFTTIKEGLDYISAAISLEIITDEVEKYIYIAAGTYEEKLTVTLPNITMIGEYDEALYEKDGENILYYNPNTIITYGAASGHMKLDGTFYGTDGSATVTIKSSAINFNASNIWFANSFDYLNPDVSNKQALAMLHDGDMGVYSDCMFTGYQDTLQVKNGRQYYYRCYIEGCTDFIFGTEAVAFFDECTIHTVYRESDTNGGCITAVKGKPSRTYGYVFENCRLTADAEVVDGTVSLGRPWDVNSNVAYIDCEMDGHISLAGYSSTYAGVCRWEDMSGNSPVDSAVYAEYGSTGDGAIVSEVAGGSVLSSAEAANYTIANVMGTANFGSDTVFDASTQLVDLQALN